MISKEYRREWRKKNPDKVRASSKKWYENHPDYRKEYAEKNRERLREKSRVTAQKRRERMGDEINEQQQLARKNNPLLVKAHSHVNNAIIRNKITKPEFCSKCGNHESTSPIEGHHEDYERPKEITWLCSVCHHRLHTQRRVECQTY